MCSQTADPAYDPTLSGVAKLFFVGPTRVTPMYPALGRVLVTGATGYVGGRLLRKLEESGRAVRCMVRNLACDGGSPCRSYLVLFSEWP